MHVFRFACPYLTSTCVSSRNRPMLSMCLCQVKALFILHSQDLRQLLTITVQCLRENGNALLTQGIQAGLHQWAIPHVSVRPFRAVAQLFVRIYKAL